MNALLRAESLFMSYGATSALAGASADVCAGEVLALTGPSGSGKSSLLLCMAGIARPDSGRVIYGTDDIASWDDDALSALRRASFGFVFQFAELVPELTLRENVTLPLELNRVRRNERGRRVDALLESLEISREADRRPGEVSGGQAQRAAVARALVHRPSVAFADEPTGSLDSVASRLVLDAFFELALQQGTAIVVATHDPEVAERADRKLTMTDGRVVDGLSIERPH